LTLLERALRPTFNKLSITPLTWLMQPCASPEDQTSVQELC